MDHFTLGFTYGIAYLPAGLGLMVLVDTLTGRVTRWVGESEFRPWLMAAFWPVLLPLVALPKYRARRGAIRFSQPKPFVRG